MREASAWIKHPLSEHLHKFQVCGNCIAPFALPRAHVRCYVCWYCSGSHFTSTTWQVTTSVHHSPTPVYSGKWTLVFSHSWEEFVNSLSIYSFLFCFPFWWVRPWTWPGLAQRTLLVTWKERLHISGYCWCHMTLDRVFQPPNHQLWEPPASYCLGLYNNKGLINLGGSSHCMGSANMKGWITFFGDSHCVAQQRQGQ